ncbi:MULTISPECIES: PEP-CTERM-box response regulator transcription factor [unclassified Arsukibacterium]|uniref:PEP-CTERM-box response regulator transcription factor n=1 Tax=unclassified Arsukibacterium TaxID=2635278 RepID=UPI000C899FBC|nr:MULTISPECIES: PEP-CTERM-box response regulator transcription factor [unclassified Arsukibacterium]MAA95150.1 PEP-CTERM-box response regulator transcription factor [Rheinheimera sp.]HAW94401.1 PEP-CTERM-box response regulator transcription factor [Candidatus Azambacteria bacterium]|tara:strand:- start:9069 stop:10427 length:1359 start_codon:yes stop_codon:yes gene_type:complete
MKTVLVVEDDIGIQKQLKWSLSDYEIVFADDKANALTQLRRYEPAVVTLDLGLPPDPANASEGLACLAEILAIQPDCKVIVLTGNTDNEHALKAVALGAYDYYQKPIDADVLNIIIQRAFKLTELEQENRALKASDSSQLDIIGNSEAMIKACRTVEKIAPTEITTLLLGESGTGKEVFARAIHKQSERAKKPFVAINCASIPENLLESELFGYEKGAFTGANKTTLGKIECANGGTLLLDEIGDMPLSLQAKMLRFLQERVIERIGGRQEIEADVRVICATHRNLAEMVAAQTFREDLYYRISEITLTIPPLRDRGHDIIIIAKALLHKFNQEYRSQVNGFTDNAIQAMLHHGWPGNIRELQNKLKSAVILTDNKLIDAPDLGLNTNHHDKVDTLRKVREQAETQAVRHAYAVANTNLSKTADLLGITRPTLYALIDKYRLHDLKNSDHEH